MTTKNRSLTRRGFLGAGLVTLAAAGTGTAWALDRFVVEHPEVTNASQLSSASPAPTTASASAVPTVKTATSYSSSNMTLNITKGTQGSGSDLITYYVADVKVSDATLIRSRFAEDTYGENIVALPSEIAQEAGALFAVNGDYYGFRDTGIIIRDGVIFRDKGARQGLAFMRDGSLLSYDETTTTANDLLAKGAWQTLSFGPTLVNGGVIQSGIESMEVDTNVGNHSIQGQQPRTGIGMIAPNHFLFVVVDGRSSGYSRGVTMTEFAQLFTTLGAQVAYNIDGGGSSVMLFDGGLVNRPLGKTSERDTSDILWIGAV